MKDLPPTAAHEWRHNWGVVFAGFIGMSLGTVHIYSMGLFIAPLEAEFSWSRSEIMLGFTLYTLMSALMTPFFGILIDRFGPRRVGIAGVISYALCLASLSMASSTIWSWWALWIMLSFGAVMIKPTVWTAAVSSLFSKGRGVALAVVLCGTGIASSFVPMLSNFFIEQVGWRGGYIGLASICLVVALPVIYRFLTSATDNARRKGNGAQSSTRTKLEGLRYKEAIFSWTFLKLAIAGFTITFAINSFVMNLVPIMTSMSIARDTAAALAGLIGITAISARLLTGYLLDKLKGNVVGGIVLLVPVVSSLCFIFAPDSMLVITFAVILLGLTLGAELDLIAYLTTRHFGLLHFGVIFGTIVSLLNAAAGTGPLLVSYIYDQTGSYVMALWMFIPLCLIASISIFSLGQYPDLSNTRATRDASPIDSNVN